MTDAPICLVIRFPISGVPAAIAAARPDLACIWIVPICRHCGERHVHAELGLQVSTCGDLAAAQGFDAMSPNRPYHLVAADESETVLLNAVAAHPEPWNIVDRAGSTISRHALRRDALALLQRERMRDPWASLQDARVMLLQHLLDERAEVEGKAR